MKRFTLNFMAIALSIIMCAAQSTAAEKPEPRVAIDITGLPFAGLANAPVTLVVFSDYL